MEGRRPPRYAGEDTRPTSQLELRGWYSYGLAAEIFEICGTGSFLPVTLEQLAREMGVWRVDRSISCSLPAPKLEGVATDNQCIIHLFGTDINTSSFALYTFSVGVMCQALTLISISAIADYGK
jgi:UMF1 family MFS transporter